MRKILKNELSWSFSRDRLFRNCKRAYYYNYYASWGWWKEKADEFTKKVNILKKMKNLAMWRGEVVHEVIKWVLEERKKGRKITEEVANLKIKDLLRKGWSNSKNKAWMKDTKKLNLFEHYYNIPVKKTKIEKIKNKTYGSIKNFYNSNFLKRLDKIPRNDILHIEDIDYFIYKNLKVYASPDFAWKSDNYYLFDWKTGIKNKDDDLQLSCYALFATKKWNIPVEKIKVIPVYLNDDNVVFKPLNKIDVDDIKDYINNSVYTMKSLLKNKESNKADLEDFPITSEEKRCNRCCFREICE